MGTEGSWDVGWRIIGETLRGWVHAPCTAIDDMSGLISGLNYFSHGLHVAEGVRSFTSRGAGVRERLSQGREAVGKIIDVLEAPQQMCADYRSVIKIRDGIAAMRRIGTIQNDPTAAAVAFGQIFSGLGELSSHLPFPANSYSDFLAASGGFFSDMQPGLGLNPANRRARQQGVGMDQRPEHYQEGRGLNSPR